MLPSQLRYILLLIILNFSLSLILPSPFVKVIIGSISGGAGALAVYPIDYIKSQLQTSKGRSLYSSGIDALFKISSTKGPLTLYRGAMIQVIGTAPEKSIKLGVNDMMLRIFASSVGGEVDCPLWGEIVSGACAGFCQVFVTNPLEVVKVKVQTSQVGDGTDNVSGSVDLTEIWKDITRDGLLKGLYRGSTACFIRDVSFSAILFPTYAHVRIFLPEFLGVDGPNAIIDAIAGGIAAAPAAFLATPSDVIKTRLQQSRMIFCENEFDYSDMSFASAFRAILENEGIETLFSGATERMVRSVPQFAVTFATFQFMKEFAMQNGFLV